MTRLFARFCGLCAVLGIAASAHAFCVPIESFRYGGFATPGTEGGVPKAYWSMPASGISNIWAPVNFPAGATGVTCTVTLNYNSGETVDGKNHCFRAGYNAKANFSDWAGNTGTIHNRSELSTAAQFAATGIYAGQTRTVTLNPFTAMRDSGGTVVACPSAAACANMLGLLFVSHSDSETGCTTNPSTFPALIEGVCVSCP